MPDRIRIGRVSASLANAKNRLRGLGLRAYDAALDRHRSTLFLGLYGADDLQALENHRGDALLVFGGGDARNAEWFAPSLRQMRHRVRVLSPPATVEDLASVGIRPDIVRGLYLGDPSVFVPTTLGRYVYVYCPYERRDEYGIDLVARVASQLRSVVFYLGRWGHHEPLPFPNAVSLPAWVDDSRVMAEIYGECFCGLRAVARDGFPCGPVELALMGRPTAHVVDVGVPWIGLAPTADEMVRSVRRAMEREGPDLALAATARAYVDDRSFLDLGTSNVLPCVTA